MSNTIVCRNKSNIRRACSTRADKIIANLNEPLSSIINYS